MRYFTPPVSVLAECVYIDYNGEVIGEASTALR